jgi:phage terminase large subunit-like protein
LKASPLHLTKVPAADIRRGDGAEFLDFTQFLRVTKDSVGGNAGEPMVMRDWQNDMLGRLFARKENGRLRHRQALIGVPRKNGKSALGAGIALYALAFGIKGGEVYSCAADKEQARIVFGTAKKMLELEPQFGSMFKCYRDAIEFPSAGSVYRVLSAEAFTKEGLNPHAVLFDEVHAQPNRELWDVMSLATGARVEPILVGITTAGVKSDSSGADSLCYGMYCFW